MSYVPPAQSCDDVYARCPRCNVCADLGTETFRGGRVFCSNCGNLSAVTQWAACGPRELNDASNTGTALAPGASRMVHIAPPRPRPAPAPSAPLVASGNRGSLRVDLGTLLLAGGVIGLVAWAYGVGRSRPRPPMGESPPPSSFSTPPVSALPPRW